jgi:hypothetical protein
LLEEVNVVGTAEAVVQFKLQGLQTAKCNITNGDDQDGCYRNYISSRKSSQFC